MAARQQARTIVQGLVRRAAGLRRRRGTLAAAALAAVLGLALGLLGPLPGGSSGRTDVLAQDTPDEPTATPPTPVGDEAFCSRESDALGTTNGGFRCLARRGGTYYVYSESADLDRDRARTPLQLAIARDPGR